MTRGIQTWSDDAIERLELEGRGKGKGPNYKPWIKVTDTYSDGRSHEPYSHKFGRPHHFLSDGEYFFFLMLEWASDVTDAREQHPLPRDLTIPLAKELGIQHPTYDGTNVPIVMTVDFLVDRVRDGACYFQVYDVKTEEALEDSRTIEKLELARYTCHKIGLEHHLVIKEHLPLRKIRSIEWVRMAQEDEKAVQPHPGFYAEQMAYMTADLQHRPARGTLIEYCRDYERRYSLSKGQAMRIVRMLIQSKALFMDLNNEAHEGLDMKNFHITAMPGDLRLVGVK
jgi:hypothetical protein